MFVGKGLIKKVLVYLYSGMLCGIEGIWRCLCFDRELFLSYIVKVKGVLCKIVRELCYYCLI